MNCVKRVTVAKLVLGAAVAVAMMPVAGFAQGAGGGRGPGGRGGQGNQMVQQVQQTLSRLDLSGEQKTKIQEVLKQAQADMRQAMQGMRDLSQEERVEKMKDLQKMAADVRTKIEAEMTADQKAKFISISAEMALKRLTDSVTAMQQASTKLEISDDVRGQLKTLFADTTKTTDGYKTDLATIKDDEASDAFATKLRKTTRDLGQQLGEILGADDAQTLMQAARPAGGPGGRQGRQPGGPGGGGQDQGGGPGGPPPGNDPK